MHCTLYTDGGSRGNPGPAGVGVVIVDDHGTPLHEAGYYLGKTTNNVAEYQGLLRGLQHAETLGVDRLTVRSDSQLLVRQIEGQYRVKAAALKPLFQQARDQLARFADWSIEHVYRDDNTRADELANLAMDRGADVIESDGSVFAETEPARRARRWAAAMGREHHVRRNALRPVSYAYRDEAFLTASPKARAWSQMRVACPPPRVGQVVDLPFRWWKASPFRGKADR